MAFPSDPLPIRAEMLISGTWTDITSRVRAEGNTGITIRRGFQNETGNSITPATADFTLNNRAAYFSTRAPSSVNYGKLPTGTDVRFSVDDPDGMALYLPNDYEDADEKAVTADKAVLDVVGDIDIQVDCKPHHGWSSIDDQRTFILMSKYSVPLNSRSWYFLLTYDGFLRLSWTTDGTTGTLRTATSTVAVPHTGRGAVRVTLDVVNGANKTVTFYTASTITGTWTQLGAAVTTAVTTSVFNSTAELVVGDLASGGNVAGTVPFDGRIYRARLYNGFFGSGGTLVADPNFAGQAAGTTSFSDGLGTPNTWTLTSAVTAAGGINQGNYRFWGEIAELPQRWDSTGADVWVPTQAADVLRRLTQGEDPVESALYRYLLSLGGLAYYPLEEDTGATIASNVYANGLDAALVDMSFGEDSALPASKSVITFNSATSYVAAGQISASAVASTYSSFIVDFKYPSVPASTVQLFQTASTGTIKLWTVSCSATGFAVNAYLQDGSSGGTMTVAYGGTVSPARWTQLRFQTHIVGAFSIVELAWIDIDNRIVAGLTSTTEFAATVNGYLRNFTFLGAGNSGLKLGHIRIAQDNVDVNNFAFNAAATAYRGETAGARMRRVAKEQGVQFYLEGESNDCEPMGAQSPATFTQILQDCADADGGLLHSRRDALALAYKPCSAMYDADSTTLAYTGKYFSGELQPTDDDQTLRNDVTISRPNGGYSRVVQADADPNSPALVGRYRSSYSLNAYTDARLSSLAGWAVYLGTWDELRYPVVQVEMARSVYVANPALTFAIARMEIGSVLKLTNLPAWLPPDDTELLLRGYTETLRNRMWSYTWNTQPYGPWRQSALLPSSSTDSRIPRLDGVAHTIGASMTTTATSVTLVTPAGSARWIDSATYASDFPFNVIVNGEVMTCTAITGTSSPQTATLTRSVNGVVKTHSSGELFRLAKPYFIGR